MVISCPTFVLYTPQLTQPVHTLSLFVPSPALIYTRTYPTLISEVKKALLNKLELQSLCRKIAK